MEFPFFFLSFSLLVIKRRRLAPSVNRGGKQGCKTNSDVTYFTFHFFALFSFFHKYKPLVTRRPAGINNTGKTGAQPSSHQLLQAPTGRERKKKVHVLYNKTCMYTHTQIYIFTYVYIHSNSMNIDFR